MDPEVLAELVVSTIKKALAPVQADVRTLQGQIAVWDARWNDLGALRERIAVVETKALTPAPDVSPLVSRADATDMQISELEKYAGRVEGYTSFLQRDLAALSERVAVVEAKAAQPPDLHEVSERLSTLQLRQEMSTAAEQALIVEMHKLTDVRERMAVLETRAPIPGPAGKDGANGADGRDGLGFDDLSVLHDGERSFTLRAVRGEQTKELGTFAIPALIYRGVHQTGKTYDNGDVVTWAGSTWVASEQTTTKPGEYAGSAVWTLCVKKGRDGRDGKDAEQPIPVVKVGAR